MYHSTRLARAFCRASLIFCFLIGAFITGPAQAPAFGSNRGDAAGSGGDRTIRGHIYVPGGIKPAMRFQVTLDSPLSGIRTTTTNAEGDFLFNGLAANTYTITIEGVEEFEPARETVLLDRQPRPVYVVPIYLKYKKGVVPPAFTDVPKPALELYEQGMEAVEKGDGAKAIEYLNGAVAAYPRFAAALSELGAQYLKIGQYDMATANLESALKLNPDDFTSRLYYGMSLWQLNKFAEAETQLRQVIKKNDNAPTAHLFLGMALARQRKLDDAEPELQRALKLGSNEPSVARAHYFLGGIYWGRKDLKRAANELEAYLNLVPNAPDAQQIRKTIAQLRAPQ